MVCGAEYGALVFEFPFIILPAVNRLNNQSMMLRSAAAYTVAMSS
jgi:hypothetical protein